MSEAESKNKNTVHEKENHKKTRRKWLKKDKEDISKKEFEALTPKQKLQVKYKDLYGENPEESLTIKKLEESIKEKNKDTSKKSKDLPNPDVHVRPSGNKDAPDTTATLESLAHADPQDWLGTNHDPDVMLSVPNLGIDHIGLNVKNLYAHVDLNAQILDLVKLHVGADVGIEEVDLQINNVRVQAMLKVKLEKVKEIVGDVVGFLDNHPEVLSDLTGGLGRGLEGALKGQHGGTEKLSDQIDEMDSKEKTKLKKVLNESDKKEKNKE